MVVSGDLRWWVDTRYILGILDEKGAVGKAKWIGTLRLLGFVREEIG